MSGRICKRWATVQSTAYHNYAPWRSGARWSANLIAALWEFTFALWTLRNEVLHETQANHPDIDPDQVGLQVIEEWTIGGDPSWTYGGTSLFTGVSCDTILDWPLHKQRQWLHYVNLARLGELPQSD